MTDIERQILENQYLIMSLLLLAVQKVNGSDIPEVARAVHKYQDETVLLLKTPARGINFRD